jgi:hypothetical protein
MNQNNFLEFQKLQQQIIGNYQEHFDANLRSCWKCKSAFSKWRGMNEKLRAIDLRNGLARETRILISLKTLESLLEGTRFENRE